MCEESMGCWMRRERSSVEEASPNPAGSRLEGGEEEEYAADGDGPRQVQARTTRASSALALRRSAGRKRGDPIIHWMMPKGARPVRGGAASARDPRRRGGTWPRGRSSWKCPVTLRRACPWCIGLRWHSSGAGRGGIGVLLLDAGDRDEGSGSRLGGRGSSGRGPVVGGEGVAGEQIGTLEVAMVWRGTKAVMPASAQAWPWLPLE